MDTGMIDVSNGPKLPNPGMRNMPITSALYHVDSVDHLRIFIGCNNTPHTLSHYIYLCMCLIMYHYNFWVRFCFLMGVLSAEVFPRLLHLLGNDAMDMHGTDEYGLSTETKAMDENGNPCDSCHETPEEREANKCKEREANKLLSTLQRIEFIKAVCKLLKIGHVLHKEPNIQDSTPMVQQMHTAPAPGEPCDDGSCVTPFVKMHTALPSDDPVVVGGLSDDDPDDIENPHDESSNGASPPVLEDGSERREPPVPHGNGDLEERHNHARPNEGLIMFALQVFQLLFSMNSKDTSLLSRNAEILQYCAQIITCIGFCCGLGGILLSNRRSLQAATRTLSAFGYFSTGLGFLATMCVPVANKFMFWILGFTGFPFSAIFGYAFWKGWIV